MKTITFQGTTYKRPRTYSKHTWLQPKRELGEMDYPMHYHRRTRPGYLFLNSYQPDDEGWSSRKIWIDFDAMTITVQQGGKDCDGVIMHTDEYAWLDGAWIGTDSEVYDQYAQAMGY